eukprot:scaffold20862_cov41-Phaeocystis_antarctica.AAC.2
MAGGSGGGGGGAGPEWKSKHAREGFSEAALRVAPSTNTVQSPSLQASSIVKELPVLQPSPHESTRQMVYAPASRQATVSSMSSSLKAGPSALLTPVISHDISLAYVVEVVVTLTPKHGGGGVAGGSGGGDGGSGPEWKLKHPSATPVMVAPSRSTLQLTPPQFSSIVKELPVLQPSPHESLRHTVCAPGSRQTSASSM